MNDKTQSIKYVQENGIGFDPIFYFLSNVQNGKKGNNNMKIFPLFIYK